MRTLTQTVPATTDQLSAVAVPPEAAAILDAYQAAHQHVENSRESACAAVSKAVECGLLMLGIKASLRYGLWQDYFRRFLEPTIAPTTAKRFMGMALRVQKGADISRAGSILEACRWLRMSYGMRPSLRENKALPATVLDSIHRFRGNPRIAEILDPDFDIDSLDCPELVELALEPIGRLWERLRSSRL